MSLPVPPAPENFVERFFADYKSAKYRRHQVIIKPEEVFDSIYYIKSGFVKQTTISKTGEEFTVNIYRPGSFFAISLALHRSVSNYTFETMTEAELIKAPASEIIKLIETEPALTRDLLLRVTSGLNSLVHRMETLVFGTAHQKVAATVLQNAQRFGHKQGDTVVISLPLTHQQIASLTGLTRETVSIEMAKLKHAGLLDYKGKTITVFNIVKLKSLIPGIS